MTDDRREGSFDELAKQLASGEVSRGRAIRLMGAALMGGTLASVPGMAWAAPPPKPNGKRCKTDSQCLSGNCADRVCRQVGCPTGETLCRGVCVTDCPAGLFLDPDTCQCVSACPDQPCCCTCRYGTLSTGFTTSTCFPGIAPGPDGVIDCPAFCATTEPPPGTQLLQVDSACAAAGTQVVCEAVSTGTQCNQSTFPPCASPPV